MPSRSILVAVIGLLAFSQASGQEFPKPGPEHEKLKELVGEWDAVMDVGGQKSKATATFKSICGGMWVASDFEGDFGGLPYQGHGLDGYDQAKKKYVSIWVDSMSTAPMQLEGTFDAGSKMVVMTGTSTGPEGEPQKVRTTTEMKDKDHMLFKFYMVESGDPETPVFTIDYTRRK